MTAMPTRPDESPPRQQDRAIERDHNPPEEVRNFETDPARSDASHDADVPPIDDVEINTHGSER
jgi:hypothetical protein